MTPMDRVIFFASRASRHESRSRNARRKKRPGEGICAVTSAPDVAGRVAWGA